MMSLIKMNICVIAYLNRELNCIKNIHVRNYIPTTGLYRIEVKQKHYKSYTYFLCN